MLDWTLEVSWKKRDIPGRWTEVGVRETKEVSAFLCSGVIQPESQAPFSVAVLRRESQSELDPDQHQPSGHGTKSPPGPSGSSSCRAICWLCPEPNTITRPIPGTHLPQAGLLNSGPPAEERWELQLFTQEDGRQEARSPLQMSAGLAWERPREVLNQDQ